MITYDQLRDTPKVREWAKRQILTWGFRSTVDALCRAGAPEKDAVRFVREMHDEIEKEV